MINVYLHGADADEIRADDVGDDAIRIANDIHALLQEDYDYLDVDGVEVDVDSVPIDEAPDREGI